MKQSTTVHTRLKEDFKDKGIWAKSKFITHSPFQYEVIHSISGERWRGIEKRCKVGGHEQKKHPNYIGSNNNFRDFQDFVEWSREEKGYKGIEDNGNSWCLDKDILGKGSKIYSEETCLYIPNRVNVFLTMRTRFRGEYPLGVTWKKANHKYESQLTYGKRIYLDLFEDPMEAHRTWQLAKIAAGREIAQEYQDSHTKLYCGLNAWCDTLVSDYENYRETIF